MLTEVQNLFKIVWDDFVVQDKTVYDTQIDIALISSSEIVELTALNFHQYNGYSGLGYGESNFDRGITEQEAYDDWIVTWNKEQTKLKKQLTSLGLNSMSQNMYDGLMVLYWVTGKFLTVQADEGIYDTRDAIVRKDLDKLADMISRSQINRNKCRTASNIIRLVDYGPSKNRAWIRLNGIYQMRRNNEVGLLDEQELQRARFSYFAETGNYLPFTPEGRKREISKLYTSLVITQFFTAGTDTEFTIQKEVSMYPKEKLLVQLQGQALQHLYDFTVSGRTLTISKTMQATDQISTQIII